MKYEVTTDEGQVFIRLNGLRGIMALVVMLSHIWWYTGLAFLAPFNKVVTIAVSVFFFLSGYGMTRSLQRKEHYTASIVKIKIPRLLFMAICAYLFSALLQFVLGIGLDFERSFLPLGMQSFLQGTNWFVFELIGFYLVFIVASFIQKPAFRVGFVFLCSAIGLIVLFNSGLVEAYCNSIFGFAFGMLAGSVNYVPWFVKHIWGLLIGIALVVVSFLLMFVMDTATIAFSVVRNLAAYGAILVFIHICVRFDLSSTVNDSLCKISPELYFYHIPITMLVNVVIDNPYAYTAIVVVSSFAVAIAMHFANKWVHKKWCSFIQSRA